MKNEPKKLAASVGKAIMLTVGMVGFVAVAAVAGNAVQLLKYTPLARKQSKLKLYEINQGIKRLLARGLLEEQVNNHARSLQVTEKGRKLLLRYELESLTHNKPPKWDNKYRVVIFDISE